MKIGFGVPVSGSWAVPEIQEHVARRADRLGYHSLWTFQRLLFPAPPRKPLSATYRSVTDPLITLAYVAALTSRARLGVAIVNLPFTSPALLAKQASTLDVLSRGRLELGLGLGWSDLEFAASGVSMRRRGARAEEHIAALTALWGEDVASFEGEFYTIPPSRQHPRPVQHPRPPLLLGGSAPAALRRIGRLADGWITASATDPATLAASIATMRAAAEAAGRDPDALRVVWRGVARLREDGGDHPGLLTGDLDRIGRGLDHLAAQGVTETFLDLNFDERIGSPDADPAESLRVADRLLDAFAPGPPPAPAG